MRIQTNAKTIVCCLMAYAVGSLFFWTPNEVEGQITYTVTGIAQDGFQGVEIGFTAVFEIDDSVVDTDDTEQFGRYPGAIISSSFTFENGFTSSIDFSGGVVTIRTDESGGGVFFDSPDERGTFLVYALDPLDSDALLSTAQEISELTGSIIVLDEPDGITSITLAEDSGAETIPGSFCVTAPSPVLLGDCNLDGAINFLDITPFIAALATSNFLPEADTNQSGAVDFLDISPFINILSAQPSS